MTEEKSSTKYEIMMLLLPDLGEKGTEDALDEVRKLLKEHGGEIYHEDIWGVRDLAYVMKGREQAYYAVFNFQIEPSKLDELKQPLNLQNEVLRYLITKTPHNYELKTLEEYEAEAKKDAEEMEKKKKEEENKKPAPAPAPKKTVKKEEKVEEKKEEKPEKAKEEEKVEKEEVETKEKEAPVAEEAPEVEEEVVEEKEDSAKKETDAKEAARKLDEVDEKLKNIINDPDISL